MSFDEKALELLTSWRDLARNGAFGAEYEECDSDCDCVVCGTEKLLEEE